VSGSFLNGLLMRRLEERLRLSYDWQLTAIVGFLGGYTTFSSFEHDAYPEGRSGQHLAQVCRFAGNAVLVYGRVWSGAEAVRDVLKLLHARCLLVIE
jgi:fluoride exporter